MQKDFVDKNVENFVDAGRLGDDFSIKEMSSLDPAKVAQFNREVYKDEFNAARFNDPDRIVRFWRWKYYDNPGSKGIKNFGYLAEYRDTLIGQFHIIPAEVKIGKEYYRSAWGSDLAVAGEYRNLGLSAFLIQYARRRVGDDFAFFLLAGMNKNSYG
ncbi:MAG: GNAT family N-acetyltransferase, partial [Candidatus Omnitrophica bacterium]|nr:GNAT family N-acetyltransferase [Candidatus Omnitrophota bacterium]